MENVALVSDQMMEETQEKVAYKRRRDIHSGDRIFYRLLQVAAWGIILLLISMIWVLWDMSRPALEQFGWRFFWNAEWNSYTGEFGARALIHGTLMTSAVALVLAVPVAVGVALFLNELAPERIAKPLAFAVEMLAAIPSVVYGLWGLFVLAPFLREHIQPFLSEHLGASPLFKGQPLGVGLMAAGVILAIMIVPTIAAISREVFKAIPSSHREAALGIGATRWEMIRLAVLKTGTPGIIGAVILGLGRALGETMAVTMVIGNRIEVNWSLLAPGQSMASVLANQYAEADNNLHLASLTAVGLALFILSLIINSVARFIVWRVQRNVGRGVS